MINAKEAYKLSNREDSRTFDKQFKKLDEIIEKAITAEVNRRGFYTYIDFIYPGISRAKIDEYLEKYRGLGYRTHCVFDFTEKNSYQIRIAWS